MEFAREKVEQAVGLMAELDIDLWLVFVRETSAMRDPMLDYVLGPGDLTWESALLISRSGRKIAIAGRFDAEEVERTGIYDEVLPYDRGIGAVLREAVERLAPRSIAVNTSRDEVHADGLTHAMRARLEGYLGPGAAPLASAEALVRSLRGRKTPSELALIREAVRVTEEIYRETFAHARVGMTERELGAFMQRTAAERGLGLGWSSGDCPAVNSGPDSPVGHSGPTELEIRPGHLLHFDFGIRREGYCSDIQRVAYVRGPGESSPPARVLEAFETVRSAIEAARALLRPGARGMDVDAAARCRITSSGAPEYLYATGHQMGRVAHDGGALLGPPWERYGRQPELAIEAGNVFTLEPVMAVPGYGYLGLEEDVVAVGSGPAEYLGQPQAELVVLGRPAE